MKNHSASLFIGLIVSLMAVGTATPAQAAGQVEKPFTTAYRYNLAGQVTGTIAPDPDGGGPLRYLARRNTYENGLLTRFESGELQSWVTDTVAPASWEQVAGFTVFVINEFVYDEFGRKIIERAKRGDTGEVESLVQFNYDTASRVLCRALRMNKDAYVSLPDACRVGPEGLHGLDRISKFTYNNLDLVVTEQRGVDTPLVQTYIRNDWAGRILRYQTDANGNMTALTYDGFDRLAQRTYPSKTRAGAQDPDDYEYFTYESTGEIKTERKRNAKVITYTYDNTNQLIKKDLSDTGSRDVYYDYYPNGLLRSSRFDSSSGPGITNSFDGFGRLVSTRINTASATTSSGASRTLSYEYDDNGNRTRVTHPDGKFFGYAYDGLNRSCGLAESAVPSTCDATQLMVLLAYRNDGGPASLARGGVTTTYVPDQVGRLSSFTLDLPGGVSNDLTNQFIYTPAGQIHKLVRSNNTYSYVGNGNRVGAYSRNGLNQITEVAGQVIQYDANGNLTSDPGSDYSLTYDMENRLVSTSGTAAVTSSFKYDPAGRLSQLTTGSATREFLYDGDALVAEYESGAVKRRYVHGNQVDRPWVEYVDSAVGAANRRYLYADQQGSIIARTDSSGGDLKKFAYDIFGSPLNANDERFGFTGQFWIGELGLYYYKARVYSPWVGRFLQTDPVGYADGYNLYAYVGNDPLNRTDPDGLMGSQGCGTCIGINSLPQPAVDFAVGAGDMAWGATIGLLSYASGQEVRDALGIDGGVTESGAYKNGVFGGILITLGLGKLIGAEPPPPPSTLRPGPFAAESIPARGPGRDFTPMERADTNRIMGKSGCHTCGTKQPGTKSGNAVPDHQPASALNPPGGNQRLFPHCIRCSTKQMQDVRAELIRRKRANEN